MLALQAPGPGGQLGDGKATGCVDMQRGFLDLERRLANAGELRGVDLSLAEPVAGDPGDLRQ